jgi:plasmid stabilization system protein ParE
MKPLHIAALAEDELREARAWYDGQAPGTGRRLVEAVNVLLDRVRENPRLYASVHLDIRRAIVPGFPYGVFYREQPDAILVVGVVHMHRHPDTWKRR